MAYGTLLPLFNCCSAAVDARDAFRIGESTERCQRPARLYVRREERVGRLIPVDYFSVTNSSP